MGQTHMQDDFAIYIKNIGGEIEKFLKDAVYDNQINNQNFYTLIERLRTLGISEPSINNLHSLRNYYNSLKHDPSFTTTIIEAEKVIDDTVLSLNEIEAKSIGKITDTYSQNTNRVLWICAWDDYIGGMTELNLFLPNYELDFPYSVEYFNISLEGWTVFKNKYTATGELQLGKEYVSEKAYNVWSKNVDMIGVGRFTGDVRELIRTLSTLINKDRESKLLEFLRRKNDSFSVLASITYAIHDTFISNKWTNFQDFKDEVYLRADFDYGIEMDSTTLEYYMNKISESVLNINRDNLKQIGEILWLNKEQFEKHRLVELIMQEPNIAITDQNIIIVQMK